MVALLEAVERDDPKDASARHSLIEAYDDTASAMSLSDPPAALELGRKALALAEELSAADPADFAKQTALASAEYSIGHLLAAAGQRSGAVVEPVAAHGRGVRGYGSSLLDRKDRAQRGHVVFEINQGHQRIRHGA